MAERRFLTGADFQRKPEPMPHATIRACHQHATNRTESRLIGRDGSDKHNEHFVEIMGCWRCWEINPATTMTRLMDLFEIPAEDQAEVIAYIRADKLDSQKRSGRRK